MQHELKHIGWNNSVIKSVSDKKEAITGAVKYNSKI